MKIKQMFCKHLGMVAMQRKRNYENMTVTLECPQCGLVREVRWFPEYNNCSCRFEISEQPNGQEGKIDIQGQKVDDEALKLMEEIIDIRSSIMKKGTMPNRINLTEQDSELVKSVIGNSYELNKMVFGLTVSDKFPIPEGYRFFVYRE